MEPAFFIWIYDRPLFYWPVMAPVKGTFVRNLAVYQLPLILYAALILAVSSFSRLPTPDLGITYLDKLAHFAEYFLFMVLMYRA